MSRIAILGASRGLGLELAKSLQHQGTLLLSSRKVEKLTDFHDHIRLPLDFTCSEDQDRLLNKLDEFKPQQIFYVSGGGPYGSYQSKAWKDHQWAYELNLIFPGKLLHHSLLHWGAWGLQKLVFIGSSIAEDQPDLNAASYCSAKHGLKGLISTVRLENPGKDIQLFSPGYMDTEMLPPNAKARESYVATVAEVTKQILSTR